MRRVKMNFGTVRTRASGPLVAAGRRAQYSSARPAERGFTYIGVMVLTVILGISLTLASELWLTVQKREKEKELLFIGNEFRKALVMYSANGGGYPRRLEDLLRDPRVPGMRRYLRKIYRDPMTGGTEWGLVKSSDSAITGVYSLSAQAPLKQADFSFADRDFSGKGKYSEWVFRPSLVQTTGGATAPSGVGAIPTGTPPRVRR